MSGVTQTLPGKRKRTFSYANELALVHSGNDFYTRTIELINAAKEVVHFQTYIFTDDSTGRLIISALKNAVKRGVKVFLLVDAFGSMGLSAASIKEIEESGINFRKFSKLFQQHTIRFGRRLHHKITVADYKDAIIGGINVEDKYRVDGPETPWLDYAVQLKGQVCVQVTAVCINLWHGKGFRRQLRELRQVISKQVISEHSIPICISRNDWLKSQNKISKGLHDSVRHSTTSVTLMASYFLPGRTMRSILRKACKRNVKIRVILPGISDVMLAKKATTYLYDWMFRNNIEIYEWGKTILHGKVNLVDDKWTSIGSYNINYLSHYGSVETNVEVYDAAFCSTVKQELDTIVSQCHKVTYSEYSEKMNWWERFTCWLSFQVIRFLFKLEFLLLSKDEV